MFKKIKKLVDFISNELLLEDDDKIQDDLNNAILNHRVINQSQTLAVIEKLEIEIFKNQNGGLLPTTKQLKELVQTRFWEMEEENKIDYLNKIRPEALEEINAFLKERI